MSHADTPQPSSKGRQWPWSRLGAAALAVAVELQTPRLGAEVSRALYPSGDLCPRNALLEGLGRRQDSLGAAAVTGCADSTGSGGLSVVTGGGFRKAC